MGNSMSTDSDNDDDDNESAASPGNDTASVESNNENKRQSFSEILQATQELLESDSEDDLLLSSPTIAFRQRNNSNTGGDKKNATECRKPVPVKKSKSANTHRKVLCKEEECSSLNSSSTPKKMKALPKGRQQSTRTAKPNVSSNRKSSSSSTSSSSSSSSTSSINDVVQHPFRAQVPRIAPITRQRATTRTLIAAGTSTEPVELDDDDDDDSASEQARNRPAVSNQAELPTGTQHEPVELDDSSSDDNDEAVTNNNPTTSNSLQSSRILKTSQQNDNDDDDDSSSSSSSSASFSNALASLQRRQLQKRSKPVPPATSSSSDESDTTDHDDTGLLSSAVAKRQIQSNDDDTSSDDDTSDLPLQPTTVVARKMAPVKKYASKKQPSKQPRRTNKSHNNSNRAVKIKKPNEEEEEEQEWLPEENALHQKLTYQTSSSVKKEEPNHPSMPTVTKKKRQAIASAINNNKKDTKPFGFKKFPVKSLDLGAAVLANIGTKGAYYSARVVQENGEQKTDEYGRVLIQWENRERQFVELDSIIWLLDDDDRDNNALGDKTSGRPTRRSGRERKKVDYASMSNPAEDDDDNESDDDILEPKKPRAKKRKAVASKPASKKRSAKSRSGATTASKQVVPKIATKSGPNETADSSFNGQPSPSVPSFEPPPSPLLVKPTYKSMRDTNIKVNRYKPTKPKSKPNIPFSVEVGDVVYLVSTGSYYRRRVEVSELQKTSAAKVVGESLFGMGSCHERLLQLRCLSTGRQWYEPESKFTRTYFF